MTKKDTHKRTFESGSAKEQFNADEKVKLLDFIMTYEVEIKDYNIADIEKKYDGLKMKNGEELSKMFHM